MPIRLLYSLLLSLTAPFFLYGLYKSKPNKPKFGKRWIEHFGFTPKLKAAQTAPLWIHTVSVGEVIAATPLIKLLKQHSPEKPIVVTTTTSTGAAEVEKLGDLVEHRYMPVDFSWAVKNFIKKIKPRALIIMETELWPNTLHAVHQQDIPISVINARLSERSYLRYKKFQSVFNLLSNNIAQLLCQNEADAKRFLQLGIETDKIKVTGSIKFDITITDSIKQAGDALRDELGKARPIWIAASTHQGEDRQILIAHQQLLKIQPDTLLILVPRHPERFSEVSALSQQHGFNTVNRTSKDPISTSTAVYIGDTMGEMLTLIGAADICFMGGSLIGDKTGGHNLLEPAALAKPCLTGPSFYNFQLITEQLLKAKACLICTSEKEIANNLTAIFSNKEQMKEMGKAALSVVEKNRGSLALTLKYLNTITTH